MVTGLEDANNSGPNLKKQFILYANGNALKEVVLQDGKYFVIESNMVYTGTWAFDLPTSMLTLTPAADSAAPPETTFKVIREDCDPQGWFPALESTTNASANGPDRLTPYGIDPEFVKKYCHIFTG
jgi:hypothetical protein